MSARRPSSCGSLRKPQNAAAVTMIDVPHAATGESVADDFITEDTSEDTPRGSTVPPQSAVPAPPQSAVPAPPQSAVRSVASTTASGSATSSASLADLVSVRDAKIAQMTKDIEKLVISRDAAWLEIDRSKAETATSGDTCASLRAQLDTALRALSRVVTAQASGGFSKPALRTTWNASSMLSACGTAEDYSAAIDDSFRTVSVLDFSHVLPPCRADAPRPTKACCATCGSHKTPPAATASAVLQLQAANERLALLEFDVHRLKKERDDAVRSRQTEIDSLEGELEKVHQRMDETSEEWAQKQRELNRLRILMRFSQLKKDSDKLVDTYRRVDTLEAEVRRLQQRVRMDDSLQTDLRRLRLLEAHCLSILENQHRDADPATFSGGLNDGTKPLLMLRLLLPDDVLTSPPDVPSRATTAVALAARAVAAKGSPRVEAAVPSTEARHASSIPLTTQAQHQPRKISSGLRAGTHAIDPLPDAPVALPDRSPPSEVVAPSPSPPAANVPTAALAPSEEVAAKSACAPPSAAAPAAPASTSETADDDVPFSVITQRMREYLERKGRMVAAPSTAAPALSPRSDRRPSLLSGGRAVTRPSSAATRKPMGGASSSPPNTPYSFATGTLSSAASNALRAAALAAVAHHPITEGEAGHGPRHRPQSAKTSGAGRTLQTTAHHPGTSTVVIGGRVVTLSY